MAMFEHFERRRIATSGAEIFAVTGGLGPPLLLLHGYPQSHVAWHAVAARLADSFSLVIPDLRGYGDSKGPPPDPQHVNYAKRTQAAEMVEVMRSLGHERFCVAGHDRGGRVAYRMALDFPQAVQRLAVLDILPTLDVWERIHGLAALRHWHWLLLAQPAPLPEQLLAADPEFFIEHVLGQWAGRREALDPRAVQDYVRHFARTSVIEAACEDYRAGSTIDLAHDRADREVGRRIRCPMLLLWARRYFAGTSVSPLAIWQRWADDVRDVAFECGHFLPEEEPELCAAALGDFFGGPAG